MTGDKKPRILILCTHNSNRSQMAEGILRALGGDRLEAYSAGLQPSRVNQNAIKVLKEIGIDISGQRSKHINEYLGQKFDYVITVCDEAAESCPFFPGETTRIHWPFEDPSKFAGTDEQVLVQFRKVRDLIRSKVSQWLGELHLLGE
jgi:arsenate reductase